mmetsp:Transcript_17875/g.37396  ORF Transcript_17875/g.37396 Transcript_17875/m.37396 type:complete len:106 (+) Transcript_17875:1073-1390(+)
MEPPSVSVSSNPFCSTASTITALAASEQHRWTKEDLTGLERVLAMDEMERSFAVAVAPTISQENEWRGNNNRTSGSSSCSGKGLSYFASKARPYSDRSVCAQRTA